MGVQLLLQHDANVDSSTNLGDNAIFWAVKKSHFDTVHLLLDYNADVYTRNSRSELPVSLALRLFYLGFECNSDVAILKLLLDVNDPSLLTYRERVRPVSVSDFVVGACNLDNL